jgi:hypothetical protein
MATRKQSFGEQAAIFSWMVPFIYLGLVTFAPQSERTEAFIVEIIFLIAGVALGIVGMSSTKPVLPKGVRRAAITGTICNAVALLCLAITAVRTITATRVKAEVVGHWRLQHSAAMAKDGPLNITLSADGAFRIDDNSLKAGPMDIVGTWSMDGSRHIHIAPISVNGYTPEPTAAKTMDLGTVRFVTAEHLGLTSAGGIAEYDRVP